MCEYSSNRIFEFSGGGSLSIGDLESCTDHSYHYDRIVCVLNLRHFPRNKCVPRCIWAIADSTDTTLDIDNLDHVTNFIHRGIMQGEHVLVHCHAGMSRSTSTVIAYMLHYHNDNRGVHGWIEAIRRYRPCVRPNDHFISNLAKYDKHQRKMQIPRRK